MCRLLLNKCLQIILNMLNMSNNKIHTIHSNSFQALQNLVKLDLSANNLKFVTEDILQYSPSLKFVNLSHNYFEEIASDFFKSSEALVDIDLSFNKLQSENILNIGPSVKYLDLRHNIYNALNLSTLYGLTDVYLAHNPWNCRWLIIEVAKAPVSLHFGYDYIIDSNDSIWSVPQIDCHDGENRHSIIVVDYNRRNQQQKILQQNSRVIVEWPQLKVGFESFDQKSVIIWLFIAVALVFTAVRMGRHWLQKSERKSEEIRRIQNERMAQKFFDIRRRSLNGYILN